MKRNNKLVKFTTFALLVTIVAISLVSGTYAKYVTKATGNDTAVVARWDVSTDLTSTVVNIFDVSKIYDTKEANFAGAGVADDDVLDGTADGIIAPGTWGKFSYVLTNESEVNATYAVDYTVNEAGVPLKWSIDGTDWTEDLADVTATALAMTNGEATITVYWKWDFTGADGVDAADTALGTATELAKPTVKVDVTFEQVD